MTRTPVVLLLVSWILWVPAPPIPAQEEAPSAEAENEPYPEHTFRLYSRRQVELRLRPDVGLRVPLLAPVFSPRTADFGDRDRVRSWPQSSVAFSLDFFNADGERDSAKAQEFRDLDGDAAVGVDAQYRSERTWLRLTGRQLLLDDQDARLELRRVGVLAAKLDLNQIPHRYAFDAASLYDGVGTLMLSIPDASQAFLQGSTSPVDAAQRLSELVAGASRHDLGHRRDRLGFELDLTAFDPLAVELAVKHETREGTRPWSGSFGLANVVEIPWPVDYETREVALSAEYKLPRTLVSGKVRVSEFFNDAHAVAFDNPWRLVDSGPFTALTSTFEEGPASGLIDLYPDNRQEEAVFTFVRSQLPGKSSFFATLSQGRLEQDDPLFPYSTNTALTGAPFDPSDPGNRPVTRADAQLDTRLVDLRWTSRPADVFGLQVHYRDYELDNETAQVFIPGFAPEDAYWRPYGGTAGGFTNLPIAHAKSELGLELAFHLAAGTRLTLDYEHEDVDRELREVERSEEQRLKLSLDAKPAPWMDLRASYLVAERDAEEYDFAQFFRNQGIRFIPVLSFLRKFDQADRDRDRAQLMASFYPTESLVLGAQLIVGEDDYPESSFGVLDDEHQVYSVDLSWAASARLSLFASYSFERYQVAIAGREWIAFGPVDPFRTEPGLDSPSNWTADTTDEIDSVAFGLEVELIPERLRLDLAYTWSKSDGMIAYGSPIGEVDNNPGTPADFAAVDDVTWYNLNPELEYTVGERLAISLAYVRERYEILDFNDEGFELVPTAPDGSFNGGLFMGTLPLDFDLDVVVLKLKVGI